LRRDFKASILVSLTYYDYISGKERVKRRYAWAAWAFVAGIVTGALLAHIL
jgi:hypothetical protein